MRPRWALAAISIQSVGSKFGLSASERVAQTSASGVVAEDHLRVRDPGERANARRIAGAQPVRAMEIGERIVEVCRNAGARCRPRQRPSGCWDWPPPRTAATAIPSRSPCAPAAGTCRNAPSPSRLPRHAGAPGAPARRILCTVVRPEGRPAHRVPMLERPGGVGEEQRRCRARARGLGQQRVGLRVVRWRSPWRSWPAPADRCRRPRCFRPLQPRARDLRRRWISGSTMHRDAVGDPVLEVEDVRRARRRSCSAQRCAPVMPSTSCAVIRRRSPARRTLPSST